MSKKDISKGISALLLIVLALLMGLGLANQWIPKLGGGWTVLLYIGIYLVPIIIYTKRNRYKMGHALRLKMVHPKYWLFILLFGLSVCLICSLINMGSAAIFRSVFQTPLRDSVVDLSGESTGALLFTSVLLPAFFEELLLRGITQGEYEKYGPTIGVLLSAVIFALFHTNPIQIPSLFVAGVCYGVLTLLFKSVWPAFFAHAINNGVAVLIAKNQDFVRYLFQDHLFIIIAVVVFFLILIFTLRMLETVLEQRLGRKKTAKRSTRSLAYGDPLMSPWIWIFALLCIGKMVYNSFF